MNYAINAHSSFRKYGTIRVPSQHLVFADTEIYEFSIWTPDAHISDWHGGNFNAVFADGYARLVDRDEFLANKARYLTLTGE